MSESAATGRAEGAAGGGPPAPLTADAVDTILRDFRAWLTDLTSGGRQPPGLQHPSPAVDLFTLVGQFTALRHEVNMQTRAARTAVEQNAEVLKQLAAAPPAPAAPADDELRPLLKAVVDVADVLALSHRQMERLRDSADPLLNELAEPRGADAPRSPEPGFFARLFGTKPPPEPLPNESAGQAADKLRQLAAAATDGYAMSLRRVDRVLPTFGLERLSVTDTPFDPETMEVVEVLDDPNQPPGTVVEEVRPGYRWRGKLFRAAQVKVAR